MSGTGTQRTRAKQPKGKPDGPAQARERVRGQARGAAQSTTQITQRQNAARASQYRGFPRSARVFHRCCCGSRQARLLPPAASHGWGQPGRRFAGMRASLVCAVLSGTHLASTLGFPLGICAACCASTRTARCASPPASRSRPEAEACNLLPLRMLCAELPLTWMPLPSRIALLLPIAPSRCTCGVPSRLVPKVELRMPEPGGRQPVASLKDALLLLPASAVRPSALVLEGASPEPGPISAAFCATRVQPAPAVPASSEAASPSRTSWGRSAGRLSLFEARGGLAGLADTQKGESRAPPSCAVPG